MEDSRQLMEAGGAPPLLPMHTTTSNPSPSPSPTAGTEPDTAVILPEGHQCDGSKVRCSRTLPCVRCQGRLSLECKPECDTSDRPCKRVKEEDTTSKPAVRIKPNPAIGQGLGSPSSSQDAPMVAAQTAVPPKAVAASTVVVDSSCGGGPTGVPELLTKAFMALREEGTLDDSRTMSILRGWALASKHYKADMTWGAMGEILDVMGPYAIVIPEEGPDPNIHPNHQLCDQAGNYLNPACLPHYITSVDETSRAVCGYICHNGEYNIFSNKLFSYMFMTMSEMDRYLHIDKLIPELAWCRLIHPSSTATFLRQLLEFMCSAPKAYKEMTSVLVLVDRYQESFDCQVKVRHVTVDGGRYSSLVMSILRVDRTLLTTKRGGASTAAAPAPPMVSLVPPFLPDGEGGDGVETDEGDEGGGEADGEEVMEEEE